MTDPFETARNTPAGMPRHSMSADVGVREARAQAMFEAHYGAKLGAWSAETRMYWLGRADNSANHQARSIIEAGLKALDTGRNEPLMIWRDQARNWLADEAALNAPTESVKAPEGEALARKFHETYERLAPSFGYETREDTKAFDPTTPNGRLMIAVCSALAPTPITADDAVAKERERLQEAVQVFERVTRLADTLASDVPITGAARAHINAAYQQLAAIRSLSPDTEGEGM